MPDLIRQSAETWSHVTTTTTNSRKEKLKREAIKLVIQTCPGLSPQEKINHLALTSILSLEALDRLGKSLIRESIRFYQHARKN